MQTVTVSPQFQVVLPQAVREQLRIEVGQKLQILVSGQRIVLLPVEAPQSLRGFLSGIETDTPREHDRFMCSKPEY